METRADWDRIAPGYDRTNTPTQMSLGKAGLQYAGIRAGMHFLDVAAGSGALSIPAARLGTHVTAVDQSAVMLDLLAARAQEEGLNIATHVMDGHELRFDDDTFDAAGSQFGVMLFPDMPRGIREMVRVVKPAGRVLMSVYGDPHRIDFLGFFVRAVQAVRPDFTGPPSDPPPLPFQLQDPRRLRAELEAAGLRDVQVETIQESTSFSGGRALWEWIIWSNPIVESILGELQLRDAERARIEDAIGELVRQRAGAAAAVLTNPINIAVGTVVAT